MLINPLGKVCLMVATSLISGCVGAVWTGASLVYDRHHVYKKMEDYQLGIDAQALVDKDGVLKSRGCQLEIAVFNADVLLVGRVPNEALLALIKKRLQGWTTPRAVYNEVKVSLQPLDPLNDTWITAKIRSQMLSYSEINPKAFKIVTSDAVVYVMGDVESDQAETVLAIARSTAGVRGVVKLLHYYRLEPLGKGLG